MKRILWAVGVVFVVVSVTGCATGRYDLVANAGGATYRIDKATGKTWVIRGDEMAEVKRTDKTTSMSSAAMPVIASRGAQTKSLPAEEKAKIVLGKPDVRAAAGGPADLRGSFYNGSTWSIAAISLTVTAKESNGAVRWSRQYQSRVGGGAPLNSGDLSVRVTDAGNAELSWAIDDIQGNPPDSQ